MHKTLLCSGLLAALSVPVHADPLTIHGADISRELPCHGRDVDITGSGNRIQLRGDCGAVVVHGSDHQVTLENAAALDISGVDNQVRAGTLGRLVVATSGNRVVATLRAAEQPAEIEVTGAEHVLDLRFDGPAKVDLSGADNQLDWQGQEPLIETVGVGHRIGQR